MFCLYSLGRYHLPLDHNILRSKTGKTGRPIFGENASRGGLLDAERRTSEPPLLQHGVRSSKHPAGQSPGLRDLAKAIEARGPFVWPLLAPPANAESRCHWVTVIRLFAGFAFPLKAECNHNMWRLTIPARNRVGRRPLYHAEARTLFDLTKRCIS